MLRTLKRLFAGRSAAVPRSVPQQQGRASDRRGGDGGAERQARAGDRYFDTMNRMQEAIRSSDFDAAARHVHSNLRQISAWVAQTRSDFGAFDIQSIPALEQGGTVLALQGDDDGLARMREVVDSTPDLAPWRETISQHERDRELFAAILATVGKQPGVFQTDIKTHVGESDGRRVANLLYYLNKAGKVARVKDGRTYKVMLPDDPAVPAAKPHRTVRSHRQDRKPPPVHEIDVNAISFVPLPRAPIKWEEAQSRRAEADAPEAADLFEVHDAPWQVASIEKIPAAERPDTAFRWLHPTDTGLIMIDDLGKAEGLGEHDAAALRYDRSGDLVAKRTLADDVYRIGVHPLGSGLIAMSREAVLHAYDDQLKPILETALPDAPEVKALRERFEIPDDQLKNHLRCVALSADARRYLVTGVDEAWCVDLDGNGLWAAKLPITEGWTEVATPSASISTSHEVRQALEIMDLSLPVKPDDVKQRYRELAKQRHPDLNPCDPHANEKMQQLTAAAERLTGIDAREIPSFTGTTYMREMGRTTIETDAGSLSVSIGIQVGEKHAADWVYAAAFAAHSDAVYLAGYSGRVVLVDARGYGQRVYDIGAVPRRIADTGDYLYLLTDTRLYVLSGDALHAVIDTYEGGELVVAQTGFGLLEKKRLRWFREDGQYLGSVLTKNPIRRVYAHPEAITIETRQHRANITGAPQWWDN